MHPLVILLVLSALTSAPALAQQPVPKPYPQVAVTLTPEFEEGLPAFRQELAAVAKRRIYAELERLVAAHGFFWERDFSSAFDPRRPPVENLAAALRLEHRNGAGWQALARFAAEPSAAQLPARLGVVCAPAPPTYDGAEVERLLDVTRTRISEWLYPRADATVVRAAARANAAAVETLGLHFVRALAADGEAPSVAAGWVRVATPTGKIGFVPPGALLSLRAARLCYGRDTIGRWQIVGYVGEE
jgi:hypothetical protein